MPVDLFWSRFGCLGLKGACYLKTGASLRAGLVLVAGDLIRYLFGWKRHFRVQRRCNASENVLTRFCNALFSVQNKFRIRVEPTATAI
jgi:hypothetical protein